MDRGAPRAAGGPLNQDRLERARSFAHVADAYERARPGYPDDAVDWLVGAERSRVVDVGAGTGKLTRQLLARGHEAIAVEPLPEMLERLRHAVPEAQALLGSAEAIPLPDSSVDVVVVAQAFHWFDVPVALAEFARVLGPGGRLGLIWNDRDGSVEWVARLSCIVGAEQLDNGDEPSALVDSSGLFGPVEEATFRLEQPLDRARLQELALSRSYVATRAPHEREEILAAIGELYDEVAGPAGFVLPYVTSAYRAART